MIFWLLNLNVTKVQSNLDGRTNSGFANHPAGPGLLYTATAENLHSKGLRRCPPDPMNHVKIFKGRPCREAFCYWYTAITNLFRLTILVLRKSESQLGWVIKPVLHNLVSRIRFWRIKCFEQDFKYLYWTISKIIIWNLFTREGTYIIDWVARAGWIDRSWKKGFSFLSQNSVLQSAPVGGSVVGVVGPL